MKKSSQFISFLIGLLLLTGCTLSQQPNQVVQVDQFVPPGAEPALAVAQSGTIVKVQPATANLKVGETVNIEIVIENVANLNGVDVELKFDPAILKAQDGDPAKDGIQAKPGPFLSPDFSTPTSGIDNTTGVVQYGIVQLPPHPAANGTGVVASIVFEAVANGTANLSLTRVDLPSVEGQPIAATLVNGQIVVGDGGAPQPTAVPPTAVPPTAAPPTAAPPTAAPPTSEPPTAAPPTAIPPTAAPGTPEPPTPIPPTSQPPTAEPPTPIVTPGTEPTEPPPAPWVDTPVDGVTVGFCYRVQPGDTLYGLGNRFGIDFRDIGLANALWPPDHIFVNQALFIPEQMGHGPNFYITRDGDTLAGIAEQCHLPVDFLARRNGYDVTDTVAPGEVMFIPIPPFAPPSRPAPMRNAPCCSSCTNDYPLPYAGPCNY